MTRRFWVLIHRYIGLTMTIFLVIVGLTGSMLAFYHELDKWLNPTLLTVEEKPQSLDAFSMREKVESLDPRARVDFVQLWREPGEAYLTGVSPRIDPATHKEYELGYSEVSIDPGTGEVLGRREFGKASLSKENILSFLYRLHFSLALPKWLDHLEGGYTIGGYILGVIALLWTLDCFIGFYITLPLKWRVAKSENSRSWWTRWKPAWLIKYSRFNFDLHRASGLWVWAMLFVLAWSSVAFNFSEVYSPTMHAMFAFRDQHDDTFKLKTPMESPKLSWREAHQVGRQLMSKSAEKNGFRIEREETLFLDRDHGQYVYVVRSSADSSRWGGTSVAFDANTGALRDESWPGNERSGDTIGRWLVLLHMAAVFGLPMKIFVCVMGIAIVALSVTGVVIWWRKTRGRRRSELELSSG